MLGATQPGILDAWTPGSHLCRDARRRSPQPSRLGATRKNRPYPRFARVARDMDVRRRVRESAAIAFHQWQVGEHRIGAGRGPLRRGRVIGDELKARETFRAIFSGSARSSSCAPLDRGVCRDGDRPGESTRVDSAIGREVENLDAQRVAMGHNAPAARRRAADAADDAARSRIALSLAA